MQYLATDHFETIPAVVIAIIIAKKKPVIFFKYFFLSFTSFWTKR